MRRSARTGVEPCPNRPRAALPHQISTARPRPSRSCGGSTTPRAAAEQAEREVLTAKYPGQFVAYLDDWDGQRLTRRVLAASHSIAEVHSQLRARPDLAAIRHAMVVTLVRDPADDEISVPWAIVDRAEDSREAEDGEPRLPG